MALALPYYPSRSKEYQRIWARIHSENPDYFHTFDRVEYQKQYYKQPEVRSRVNKKIQELRLTILTALGGKCIKCGFTDHRALQLDHIHGNGSAVRKADKTHRNRETYYKKLLNDPEYTFRELQVLCANCNWIKRYENNEVNNCLYGVK